MSTPFYQLDEHTVELLSEVLQYAMDCTGLQKSSEVKDHMYSQIAEVHERFNLPQVDCVALMNSEDIVDIADVFEEVEPLRLVSENDGPVQNKVSELKPMFTLISGGKVDAT